MASGGCHFEGTLHVFLTFHFGKVEVERTLAGIKLFSGVDYGGFERLFTVEKAHYFAEIVYAIYSKIVYYGSFAGILSGDNHALEAQFACLNGNGQCPFDGFQAAVQAQFAHQQVAV